MQTQVNSEQSLLFKIDLKVGGRILTLNVKEGDTIQSLLIKHKMANQETTQKLEQLKEKIRTNIHKQMQIKIYSNQLQLASKMQAFLLKQNQQQTPPLLHKEYSIQNRLNQNVIPSQTPFKLLFEKTLSQVREQSRQSPSVSQEEISYRSHHKNDHQTESNVLKEVYSFKNHTNTLKPQTLKSVSLKPKTRVHRYNESHKKWLPHKMDEDLIKAYEVIWKKSKDKTMRQMAENTLKGLKVLPQENNITDFLLKDSKSIQKEHFTSTGNKPQIESLTFIEKNDKEPILHDGFTRIQPISDSRSFARKNYRFSYLEENMGLIYPYEKKDNPHQKYSYNRLDETYINILKKNYDQENNKKVSIQGHFNRRYSYLDD